MLTDFIIASGEARRVWAERFGVSAGYLSDLERGKKTPSLEVAVRIERVTGGAVPAVSWIGEDAA